MRKAEPSRSEKKGTGHYIYEWRKYRMITQRDLAERIGMTSGAISQMENGLTNYTQPTLEAIAKALDCQPGDILSVNPLARPGIHRRR